MILIDILFICNKIFYLFRFDWKFTYSTGLIFAAFLIMSIYSVPFHAWDSNENLPESVESARCVNKNGFCMIPAYSQPILVLVLRVTHHKCVMNIILRTYEVYNYIKGTRECASSWEISSIFIINSSILKVVFTWYIHAWFIWFVNSIREAARRILRIPESQPDPHWIQAEWSTESFVFY